MDRGAPSQRDVRLMVGAVGISATGEVLLSVPLTLHLLALAGGRRPAPATEPEPAH
jgi:hypothetical protein